MKIFKYTVLVIIIIFIQVSVISAAEECQCDGLDNLVEVFKDQNQLISAGHKDYVHALHQAAQNAGLPEAVEGIKKVVEAIPKAFEKVDSAMTAVTRNSGDIVDMKKRIAEVESLSIKISTSQENLDETTKTITYWLITISVGVFFTLLSALGILLIMLIKTLRHKGS